MILFFLILICESLYFYFVKGNKFPVPIVKNIETLLVDKTNYLLKGKFKNCLRYSLHYLICKIEIRSFLKVAKLIRIEA